MRSTLLMLVALATSVVLAGCSTTSSELTGKQWQLTAITEKVPAYQGVIPATDQGKYTITFNTDGTFNATADCNAVAGTYKTSGSSLTITLGPSTLVACPEGSFGDLFAHALGNAASYAIADSELTITLTDGGTLAFAQGSGAAPSSSAAAVVTATPTSAPTATPSPTPTAKPSPTPTAKPSASGSAAPPATPKPTPKPTPAPTPAPSPGADLVGPTWKLTNVTEKVPAFQAVVPAADQAKYTIAFAADGTFSAQADCNKIAGTWAAAAGGVLAIAIGPSSLVACADGSLSDLYILGLGNAASYAVANGGLTITLHDQGTLVFGQ